MMEYKGYLGRVEFDETIDAFAGNVLGLRDVITFESDTVEGLRQAFHDSVDDYLEFCAERGEEPDRSFSGKFNVRVDPVLHREIAETAELAGMSMNAWIASTLHKNVVHHVAAMDRPKMVESAALKELSDLTAIQIKIANVFQEAEHEIRAGQEHKAEHQAAKRESVVSAE